MNKTTFLYDGFWGDFKKLLILLVIYYFIGLISRKYLSYAEAHLYTPSSHNAISVKEGQAYIDYEMLKSLDRNCSSSSVTIMRIKNNDFFCLC